MCVPSVCRHTHKCSGQRTSHLAPPHPSSSHPSAHLCCAAVVSLCHRVCCSRSSFPRLSLHLLSFASNTAPSARGGSLIVEVHHQPKSFSLPPRPPPSTLRPTLLIFSSKSCRGLRAGVTGRADCSSPCCCCCCC